MESKVVCCEMNLSGMTRLFRVENLRSFLLDFPFQVGVAVGLEAFG